jgi:hypothetical protein
VKVAVLTFNDHTSLLADFGEPVARVKAKMRHLRTTSGTNDWFAIRTAHDMLLRRSEARRVCFVLTDGDGDRAAVRAQCISGAALGITTIGVGIGIGNSVDRVYPVGVKVPDVNALATVALSKIKVAA